LMWGFQIWVNLPSKSKMTRPRYQDMTSDAIPTYNHDAGVSIRVIAGEHNNLVGPVRDVDTDPLYLDVSLSEESCASVAIPTTHNRFLYCYSGALSVGRTVVEKGTLALLSNEATLTLCAGQQSSSAVVLAGLPTGEPVVRYGPFVMNTREEIKQAFYDAQNGLI
jgi:quercetin 2,3-dioxygenase